jgi:PIN domain nuclease of toxin-antitoxin system
LIILDTHVLIWLDQGVPALGDNARQRANGALREEALAIATVSFWEIATLCRRGRLKIGQPIAIWRRSLFDLGLQEVSLDGEIAIVAGELEGLHGDPADRIIIATSILSDATLLTADQSILDWHGSLKRLDARA